MKEQFKKKSNTLLDAGEVDFLWEVPFEKADKWKDGDFRDELGREDEFWNKLLGESFGV